MAECVSHTLNGHWVSSLIIMLCASSLLNVLRGESLLLIFLFRILSNSVVIIIFFLMQIFRPSPLTCTYEHVINCFSHPSTTRSNIMRTIIALVVFAVSVTARGADQTALAQENDSLAKQIIQMEKNALERW